jgi:lipopolysaccharide/colanic/teichoic acid biosynthesis glycosyltransferase
MLKRIFDIVVSGIALVILSIVFLVIAITIKLSGPGPVFYLQTRVGRNGSDFTIYKFRTMHTGADKSGLLTVGGRDNRITTIGYFLRKYKLDELPQLINVLLGDMSLVGPRPEVRKYVSLYSPEQLRVLSVKPGITEYASIIYSNENEILGAAADPEKEYIQNIMPAKLALNLEYIKERSFSGDLKILAKTVTQILTSN